MKILKLTISGGSWELSSFYEFKLLYSNHEIRSSVFGLILILK